MNCVFFLTELLFSLWTFGNYGTLSPMMIPYYIFIIEKTYTHRTPRKTKFLGSHLSQKTQKHLNNKNPIKAYQCTSIVNENVWNFLFHFFISLFQYLRINAFHALNGYRTQHTVPFLFFSSLTFTHTTHRRHTKSSLVRIKNVPWNFSF